MKNVLFLFGVNGVGKSTLARAIAAVLPGARVIGASDALRHAFDGATRDELERMDPAEKKARLSRVLLRAFAAQRDGLAVCDMHLVVPIRAGDSLRHERMWDDDYLPHARALVYVCAPPAVIADRRAADAATGTRIRRLRDEDIAADDALNRTEFRRLFAGRVDAAEIVNDGAPAAVAAACLSRIKDFVAQ